MSDAIAWHSWSTEAFSRAHSTHRPVLLVIVAPWSASCRVFAADVLADPRVARLIRDRVVPIRVDADRRPDIADRYGAGGWPTTLFLTADGEPICGGTYVDAARLATTIADVADRCQRDPDAIRLLARESRALRRAQEAADLQHIVQMRGSRHALESDEAKAARPRRASEAHVDLETRYVARVMSITTEAPLPREADGDAASGRPHRRDDSREDERAHALAWIASRILLDYDPVHAGFGADAKFPLVAPVAFALHYGQRTADDDLIDVAMTTLDRMGWDGLSPSTASSSSSSSVSAPSAVHGAFHRACARPDWTEPDSAHLLDIHADLLRLYLDAWTITQHDRYRDRARDAWAYVDRVLHDRADGGFFTSEADDVVDRVLLTDANAKMIRALLHASQIFEEASYAESAARAAERLLPAVYSRGAGVAHVLDTHARVRGLLTDQIHASAALLDLGLVTGDRAYLDLSDELLRSALRKLWDADRGAFVDRLRSSAGAGDVGLLGEPLRPFALNAEAARLLDRLGREHGHAEFTAHAAELRDWLAATYQSQGVLSAEYGLVLLEQDVPQSLP